MQHEKKQLNLFENYKNLEDNITHGFISVLKCIENKTARNIIEKLTDGIKLKPDIFYDIQSPSLENKEHFQKANIGYLLGISSLSTYIKEDITHKKDSRADAWISDREKVLLIESKIGSEFSGDQLKRHEKKLEKYNLSIKPRIFKTWQNVDSIFDSIIKGNDISNVEKKLLLDYRRYLQMSGITLDFEKFYNDVDYNIKEHWFSDEPRKALGLLKEKISKKINIKIEKEQTHETRMNYYWLRLFSRKFDSIEWRGTVYLEHDAVSVDIMAFKSNGINKTDIPQIVESIKKISKELKGNDRLRTWIYVSNYGKRRNVQSGINYEYDALNFNLEKADDYLRNFQNLTNYSESVSPKQMGIKYSISNPGSKSETYWKKEGEDINHEDAKLLKDPEKVVENFVKFINLSVDEISKL